MNFLKDNKTQLVMSFVLMLLGVVTCVTKTSRDAALCVSVAVGCFAVTIWAWRNKADWPMRGASAFNFFAFAGLCWFQR